MPTAVKSHSEMLHTYRRAEILSDFGVIKHNFSVRSHYAHPTYVVGADVSVC